jgi:hypothetical protein
LPLYRYLHDFALWSSYAAQTFCMTEEVASLLKTRRYRRAPNVILLANLGESNVTAKQQVYCAQAQICEHS